MLQEAPVDEAFVPSTLPPFEPYWGSPLPCSSELHSERKPEACGPNDVPSPEERLRRVEQRLEYWGHTLIRELQVHNDSAGLSPPLKTANAFISVDAPLYSSGRGTAASANFDSGKVSASPPASSPAATTAKPMLVLTPDVQFVSEASRATGRGSVDTNGGRKSVRKRRFRKPDPKETVDHEESETVNAVPQGRQLSMSDQAVIEQLQLKRREAQRVAALRGSWKAWRHLLQHLALKPQFDACIGIVICVNAIVMGAQVHLDATTGDVPSFLSILETICSLIFAIELVFRLTAFGGQVFVVFGLKWTFLDVVLVLLSFADWFIFGQFSSDGSGGASGFGKVLKVVRMSRVLRLLRMFRFLSELRVLLQMVVASFASLLWLIVFLLLVLYAFAITLTRGVTDFLDENILATTAVEAKDLFGGLFETMYTLFKCISGGVNWGVAADIMLEVGTFYFSLFLLFMFFMLLCVLNLVTGVMVDGAIELSKQDRAILVEKQGKARDAAAGHLLELLEQIDKDGNGTISRDEFIAALANPELVRFMEALEIDTSEALEMYDIIDRDGDNDVDVHEWVDGMRRLKGDAKSADIQKLRAEVRSLEQTLDKFLGDLQMLLPVGQSTSGSQLGSGLVAAHVSR